MFFLEKMRVIKSFCDIIYHLKKENEMASTNLMIPKKLKIGFQNRKDALTEKLGYVIYYDEKGVLRKKTSWENWRSKDIEPLEVDNQPVSGYVINKGVTHFAYSSFGSDRFRVRVHSPLGFDFEIYPENLLAIMSVSDISKQYINNECVFAWDGQELILLPVNTEQYKQAVENTKDMEEMFNKKKKAGNIKNASLEKGTIVYGNQSVYTYVDEIEIIPSAYVENFKLSNLKLDKKHKVILTIPKTKQKIGVEIAGKQNKIDKDFLRQKLFGNMYFGYTYLNKIPDNALVSDINISEVCTGEKSHKVMRVMKETEDLIKKIPDINDQINVIELKKEDIEKISNYYNHYSIKETDSTFLALQYLNSLNLTDYFYGNEIEKENVFSFIAKDLSLYKVKLFLKVKDWYTNDKRKYSLEISFLKIEGKNEVELFKETLDSSDSQVSKKLESFILDDRGNKSKNLLLYINDMALEKTGSNLTVLKMQGIMQDGKVKNVFKVLMK